MFADSPILAVAEPLHAACLRDYPTIVYLDRDWNRRSPWLKETPPEERARVYQEEGASGQL